MTFPLSPKYQVSTKIETRHSPTQQLSSSTKIGRPHSPLKSGSTMVPSTRGLEPLSQRSLQDQLSRSASLNAIPPLRRRSAFFTDFYNSLSSIREPSRASRRTSTLITTRDTASYLEKFVEEDEMMQQEEQRHGEESNMQHEHEESSHDGMDEAPPVPTIDAKWKPGGSQEHSQVIRRPVAASTRGRGQTNTDGYGSSNGGPAPRSILIQSDARRQPRNAGSGTVPPRALLSFGQASRGLPAQNRNMGPPPPSRIVPFSGPSQVASSGYDPAKCGEFNPFMVNGVLHPNPLHSNPVVGGSNMTATASQGDMSRPIRAEGMGSDRDRVVSDKQNSSTSRVPRPGQSSYGSNRDLAVFAEAGNYAETVYPGQDRSTLKKENIPPAFIKNQKSGGPAYNHSSERGDALGSEKSSQRPANDDRNKLLSRQQQPVTLNSEPSSSKTGPIRKQASRPQFSKSPSVMNLDEVAEGADPINRDTPPLTRNSFDPMDHSNTQQYGASPGDLVETTVTTASPIVKKKKSFFRKGSNDAQKATKKQSLGADLVDESSSARDPDATPTTAQSLSTSVDNLVEEHMSKTPKASRNIFGFTRKAKSDASQPLLISSPIVQDREDGHSTGSISPEQFNSSMGRQPDSLTGISLPTTQRRNATDPPMLPSQLQEASSNRLMQGLPPGPSARTQGKLPKSKTMGMLTRLTPGFSRSRTNLDIASTTSLHHGRPAEPYVSTDSATGEQSTTAATVSGPVQVTVAMGNGYWSGRFSSINDRLKADILTAALRDPNLMGQYQDTTVAYDFRARGNDGQGSEVRVSPVTRGLNQIQADEDRNAFRAFDVMKSECASRAAEDDLWNWQLEFARLHQKIHWLPVGGLMKDKETFGSKVLGSMGLAKRKG